jgi:anti-sigma factor RsiW
MSDDTQAPPGPDASAPGPTLPVTEADLHAYADGHLPADRAAQIAGFLAAHPDSALRVRDWTVQNAMLREAFRPVLDEPLPLALPLRPPASSWPWRSMAAAVAIASIGAIGGWTARGALEGTGAPPGRGLASARPGDAALSAFAHRAAVAHAVYSPDARRPVEVGAEQEQALATWLTRRMGATMRAPALGPLGYQLMGGRLLPGSQGPVAQFMYADAAGRRLTLYASREFANTETAFRFTQDGSLNVFYWVDGAFGYAISAEAGRDELQKVSQEVYGQLRPAPVAR